MTFFLLFSFLFPLFKPMGIQIEIPGTHVPYPLCRIFFFNLVLFIKVFNIWILDEKNPKNGPFLRHHIIWHRTLLLWRQVTWRHDSEPKDGYGLLNIRIIHIHIC